MIKRFHEAPISIFELVQSLTDGDYALVHLFQENAEYRNMFYRARDAGREIILDNSVFELGPKFDVDVFADCVKDLKPTYYIVPDVPENLVEHLNKFYNFVAKYPDLPGKRMGVVQGKTPEELFNCYRQIAPVCDKIAISMDYGFWNNSESSPTDISREFKLMQGRRDLLQFMHRYNIVDKSKPHHLLGVQLPQEVIGYSEMYPWIDSIDTSNPVVHGLIGQRYFGLAGLPAKHPVKLADYIDRSVTAAEWRNIEYNIDTFRRMCNE